MGGYIGSKGVGIISGIDASIADLNLTDKEAANGVTEANKVLQQMLTKTLQLFAILPLREM